MDAYELLTKDEMTILKEHYTTIKDCITQDQRDRALKDWSTQRKQFVAKLLERLRAHGLAIAGLYPSGSLRFSSTVKTAVSQLIDLSEEDFLAYRKGLLKFVGGKWCRLEAACQ